MAVQIQWRRDTAANWTAVNPILAEGEMGLETDTGKVKLGNGGHAWNALPYFSGINAASAGISSISSGPLVFSNSNGVSFGLSGSTITASVASAGGGIALSAGTQSASTGTVVFSNSNGISFGMNGSSRITASHNGISAVYVSAGLYDQLLSAITFSDANGVSFGLDGGSVITASVSNQGIALSAGTQSVSTGTLKFDNSNGISFGMSGSSRVTASYTVPSTAGLISAINVSGGTTSNNLSALTFSDGGNVSFGLNGSVITASAPAGGGGGALSVGMSTIGNTSGDTGLVESRLVLAGGNNITLSGNTGALNRMTITVSGPNVVLPSAGTQTAASGTVVFANSNGITFGMSGSSQITASHNGLTTQSAQAFSADASSTFQTLSFQDSNGVSFSNNAGALRITHGLQYTSATSAITSNALNTSASRVINIVAATNNTAGGAASLSSNVSFSAANGITFYTSAGNAIVASHNALTTARASNDAIGLNTAQTNVTWTANSSGLSFNAAGYAGTTTAITGNALITHNSLGLRFDGAGLAGTSTGFAGANISGSMTHNSAGLNLSLSVAAPGGGGGVALSAGTQSVSTGTVVFSNSNGITFGMSGSSQITASYNSTQFAGTGTTFAGANASGSMTLNSNGLNLSMSVAAPGAAAEQNAINLLGANTAGNTTATGSTIGMSGINLTLSGTNASQIVFSAPATSSIVGVSGISLSTAGSTVSIMPAGASYFAWPTNVMLNSQTQTVVSNTSVVFPIELHDLEHFDFVMLPATVSIASMASIATAANNTKSYTQAGTSNFVLYSRGVGASSQSLQYVASTQHTSQMTIAIGQNANGSQWTVTHAFSFPVSSTGQATFSTSYATTLSNVNVSTTHLTAISGAKKLGFPWATSLSNGQYWMMTGMVTAATTNGSASLSNMRVTQSMYAASQVNLTWGEFGSANNSSIQAQYGIGSYTKAASGTTDSIGFTAISSSSSHNMPYITLGRIA
jgi:hypothetical protein